MKKPSRTRPQVVDRKQVQAFIANAEKKLRAARKAAAIDTEAAFEMTYGAMMKAGLALMLSHGLRPRAVPGHHQLVIEFSRSKVKAVDPELISLFDRMRRKRSLTFYDLAIVGEEELAEALKAAEEYVRAVEADILNRLGA